jgi:hypothetical protein
MFNAQEFINKTRHDIADDRRKAGWFKLASYAVRFVVVAILITGLIESLALTPFPSLLHVLNEIGATAWYWMNDNVPPLWSSLRSISPYLILTPPLPWLSWLGFFLWIYGLTWFGFKLLGRSASLYQQASKTEETLNFQAPILLQMQSIQRGDISGDVFAVVNTINNIRERDEKSWWSGPIGLIVIGVATAAISKFLHLS